MKLFSLVTYILNDKSEDESVIFSYYEFLMKTIEIFSLKKKHWIKTTQCFTSLINNSI